MKILFYAVLLSLAFLSCNSTTFTKCSYEETGNLCIIIPVTINGKTFKFLFDTGTDETLINSTAASQLNIKPVNKKLCEINSPSASIIDTVHYLNSELYIQGMSFSTSALCIDRLNVSFSERTDYKGYDGILGNRDIKKKNWLFDIENKCFMLSDITESLLPFAKEYDQVLELKMNDNYTNIRLEDSVNQTFLFDTGWGHNIIFNYDDTGYTFYADFAFRDSFIADLRNRVNFEDKYILMKSFGLNDTIMKYLSATKNVSNVIKSNIIAAPFLRRFKYMLYDSKNQKICLFRSAKGYGYKGDKEKELLDKIMERYLSKEDSCKVN